MTPGLFERGFLPVPDPARKFEHFPELEPLSELGRDLPSLLHDPGCRNYLRALRIPHWPLALHAAALPREIHEELRLYYLRVGFIASGYINQVGQPAINVLPANIAVPLCRACELLRRPPILSYDGYALYNWKRFDPRQPIVLGNIDTLQNFVHLYDERWFILVHVEIEARAGDLVREIAAAHEALIRGAADRLNASLHSMAGTVGAMAATLRRIPEKMDPALYYRTFRPYIRFFENVVYEGVTSAPMDFRGETGAQSSIMPLLVEFLKIPHQPTPLTDHLRDMRRFMPAEHRACLNEVADWPAPRPLADRDAYNAVIEAVATFREVHLGWAREYIQKWVTDPRGTGGTPYMKWLQQLIDETRAQVL